ncbi:MAG: hypothetical protein ACE5IZ_02165 [Dehalococcoidia bacterium]
MHQRLIVALITVALLAFSAVAGLLVLRSGPSDPIAAAAQPFGHDLLRWEVRHLPGRWLYLVGQFLRGGSDGDDEAVIRRYFDLGQEVSRLQRLVAERDEAAAAELAEVRRQRQDLENRVERIIEGRITSAVAAEGLTTSPPLFGGIDIVFPPVSTEFDGAPGVLIISPRDRISLDRLYLLRSGITVEEVLQLEAEAEATGVSALVDVTGGVASYPSVISDRSSYDRAVELAAHEWIHQYLFFRPLGRRFFQSGEMRTINETVANIAGREIAQLVRQRFSAAGESKAQAAPAPTSDIDFSKEMHQLRLAVDDLLAQGKIEEAEALMEEKRRFLEEHGFYIRKINQAFFAFHGTYADTPASSSPIGPKVQQVRQRSSSVGEFVRTMAPIASLQGLDQLLAELGAPTQP